MLRYIEGAAVISSKTMFIMAMMLVLRAKEMTHRRDAFYVPMGLHRIFFMYVGIL